MRRVVGPDCPGCGCQQAVRSGASYRWGVKWIDYECAFCQRSFRRKAEGEEARDVERADEPSGIVRYPHATCPACGSTDVPVTSTRREQHLRWHKCAACRHCFKSIERGA